MLNLIDFSKLSSTSELLVSEGVKFGQNSWRIQWNQSEHITLDFSFGLGDGKDKITNHPDLLIFMKILTYYSFPTSPFNKLQSWDSTLAKYWGIYICVSGLFYRNQITTASLISNVTLPQLHAFVRKEILAAETDSGSAFSRLVAIQGFLRQWCELSELDVLPPWAKLSYDLLEVLPSKTSGQIRNIAEEAKITWLPLDPDTIKACYDESVNYIRLYAGSIISCNQLVKSRPRFEEGALRMVRQDGATKHLFNELVNFTPPLVVGTDRPLFELPVVTKLVKSQGYTSGWQNRTWVAINQIRPQTIHLKRACIFIIGLFTGLRRREIAELPAKPAYRKNDSLYIDIRRFKTSSDPAGDGELDSIPVPAIVAEAIDVLLKLLSPSRTAYESDYLLVTDIATSKKFEKTKRATVGKDIKDFIIYVTGSKGHAHQLRKAIAWLLISRSEKNVDLIRQLFGHRSYGMALRYILRNELLVKNVIELVEHNYTEDLQLIFSKIAGGEEVVSFANKASDRSGQNLYRGQILASDIETFVRESLLSGVPLYVSHLPIGGFCVSAKDLRKKPPPCFKVAGQAQPDPEFCDYKICEHFLSTVESTANVEKQISYYQHKLNYLENSRNSKLVDFYAKEILDHQLLLERASMDHQVFFRG